MATGRKPNEDWDENPSSGAVAVKYPHIQVDISHLDVVDYHQQFGNMVVEALNRAGVDRNFVINYARLSLSLSIRSLGQYTETLVVVIDKSGIRRY